MTNFLWGSVMVLYSILHLFQITLCPAPVGRREPQSLKIGVHHKLKRAYWNWPDWFG